MGVKEIEEFLTHLAIEKNVAVPTQNQAFNEINFNFADTIKPLPKTQTTEPKQYSDH
ncbi:MAG: phage integrase N-terminal SAM-like domain-containing protein [Xenococcus sp. (in: cyanobacteria)]